MTPRCLNETGGSSTSSTLSPSNARMFTNGRTDQAHTCGEDTRKASKDPNLRVRARESRTSPSTSLRTGILPAADALAIRRWRLRLAQVCPPSREATLAKRRGCRTVFSFGPRMRGQLPTLMPIEWKSGRSANQVHCHRNPLGGASQCVHDRAHRAAAIGLRGITRWFKLWCVLEEAEELVERAGFEPAYACAGRFTVCYLSAEIRGFSGAMYHPCIFWT